MKRMFQYLAILLVVTYACKQKPAEEQTSNENEATKVMFSKLPSPIEVAARIQATGADFNQSILSDPGNATAISGETNRNKIAANLGVFLSDMGYCIVYQQKDETKQYYDAASMLADKLGVKKDVLGYMMNRYDQNLENNDSLKTILSELYNTSTNDVSGDDASLVKGVISSAMYIESLHTLLGIINTYPKDMLPDDAKKVILAPLFRVVLNQKQNVHDIKAYLDEILPNAPNAKYYDNAFNELSQLYDNLDIQNKIENNQLEELLNDQVVQELITKVGNIRDEVLKTSDM